MTGTSVVYPRFLGMDENGDFVWELADGRWTWGDDPYQAANRKRTFAPDRYVDKYGAPQPLPGQGAPEQAEEKPAQFSPRAVEASAREAFADGKKRGAEEGLRTLLEELAGWIEGARENHLAMEHRGENTGEECWRLWAPADFRSMVNDAARRLGVAEFPVPAKLPEDKRLKR